MDGSPQLALAAAALGLSCVVSLYVGSRTLLVWQRTRGVAELSIGLNVLSISIGGALFAAFVASPALKATSAGPLMFGLMVAMLITHPLAMSIGTWRIFRPSARWPLVPIVATVIAMTIYAVIAYMPTVDEVTRSHLYEATRLALYTWTAYECFRYSGLLKRRVKLGLAEPIVAHRIKLWGIAGLAQIPTSALPFIQMLGGGDAKVLSSADTLYVASVLGVVGTGSIALAFFPPAFYTRWIEGSQPASTD